MSSYDVIVLGGGIIGASVADELARRGRRVCLIERGTVGGESSKAAAGILAAQLDIERPGPFFELCQASRRMYASWVRSLESRSKISVGYHQEGVLHVALTKADAARMERRRRWQAKLGLAVERWTPAEIRRQEPAVDGRLVAGFFFPLESQVDNARLMDALAVACRKAGVTVMEGATVTRLAIERGRVKGALTNRGLFRAQVAVNCLGSWAGFDWRLQAAVSPARGQILAYDAPKGLLRHAVMATNSYGVQRRNGRLLVGSTIELVGYDKRVTLDGMERILSGFRQFIRPEALARCTFQEAWAGLRPHSADGLPIIGPTRITGLYAAFGHFRHGILLAPLTARLMAESIVTSRSSFDLSPFSPLRF
ncbi:MAG: glycine oxidase ThiO [Candidatus Omnitrophica bacterium]|nr:glycine oxidase ThiO [Candidatus Omnitrophota bacterium]